MSSQAEKIATYFSESIDCPLCDSPGDGNKRGIHASCMRKLRRMLDSKLASVVSQKVAL